MSIVTHEQRSPGGNASLAGALPMLVMATALASVDVLCGFWDHDGGALLLQSAYIAEGYRPYIDFATHHPPLTQILGALPVALGVDRLVITVVFPLLLMAGITAATFALLRLAGADVVPSLWVACLYPLFSIQNGGNHVANELGVALFSLGAFMALVRAAPLTPWSLAAAGFLASAATLSKQNGAVAFVLIGAACAAEWRSIGRRHIAALVAGAAILPLAVVAWLGFDLAVVHEHLVERLVAYGTSTHPGATVVGEYRRAPETVLLFAAAIILGIAVGVNPHAGRRDRVLALAGAAGVCVQLLPRLLRNYPHYNLSAWPYVALLFALVLALPRQSLRTAATIVAAALAVSGVVNGMVAPTWDTPGLLLSTYVPAAQTIQKMTDPQTPVRQYGAEPILEFLAHRREEAMSWPLGAHVNWDGHGRYEGRPPAGVAVVVVDAQRPWVRGVIHDLERWGYREAVVWGRHPRVRIFRGPEDEAPTREPVTYP